MATYGRTGQIPGPLKEQARLAGREAFVSPDIRDPDLILPPMEEVGPISCPQAAVFRKAA
jgi:hypothetical protein